MSDLTILPAAMDVFPAWLVGRVWCPDVQGPSLCTIWENTVIDITSSDAPTMRDLLELANPVSHVQNLAKTGTVLGAVEQITAQSVEAAGNTTLVHFLAPNDLQSIKACGVTFAQSMIERVIEEKAAGDTSKASIIRDQCAAIIGHNLRHLVAGSEQARAVKATLIAEGLWSQYLEVGIGPDAEIFTKSQPMSAVGWGASVGLHPISNWNNPEPEIVLAVDSQGVVKGATLGNDVNLRDVEGRSALLLGKAKDNNASCAIGPFIRLFDANYTIDNVRQAEVDMIIAGEDEFVLHGKSNMRKISRDPLDLVAQTRGRHHQYPDGFMLFMGTLFSPTEDRDQPGEGFTHKMGDVITIKNEKIGTLTNTVRLSTDCPEWTFGSAALMRNLVVRHLL